MVEIGTWIDLEVKGLSFEEEVEKSRISNRKQ